MQTLACSSGQRGLIKNRPRLEVSITCQAPRLEVSVTCLSSQAGSVHHLPKLSNSRVLRAFPKEAMASTTPDELTLSSFAPLIGLSLEAI